MGMVIEADDTVWDRPRMQGGRQLGYFNGNVLFSGGTYNMGGRQFGYIQGDLIFQGGTYEMGGRQVGYLQGDDLYEGGTTWMAAESATRSFLTPISTQLSSSC